MTCLQSNHSARKGQTKLTKLAGVKNSDDLFKSPCVLIDPQNSHEVSGSMMD